MQSAAAQRLVLLVIPALYFNVLDVKYLDAMLLFIHHNTLQVGIPKNLCYGVTAFNKFLIPISINYYDCGVCTQY